MTHHVLKTHPVYFEQVRLGLKSFELRKNDRDFKVGDTITLREWDPERPASVNPIDTAAKELFGVGFEPDNRYTGRELAKRVTYVLQNFEGLADGYCIFAMEPLATE